MTTLLALLPAENDVIGVVDSFHRCRIAGASIGVIHLGERPVDRIEHWTWAPWHEPQDVVGILHLGGQSRRRGRLRLVVVVGQQLLDALGQASRG